MLLFKSSDGMYRGGSPRLRELQAGFALQQALWLCGETACDWTALPILHMRPSASLTAVRFPVIP